ncbi:MAG TPA: O-antigen ligase family protein [Candidatus Binatia bacterium]|nr:O-antigen ligase family protein [Candidatus Binatia bacterium]
MQKVITWWERGLIAALVLSIALLGTGRLESPLGSIGAWSVSRTTFFFWIGFKLLLMIRGGWAASGLPRLRALVPLYCFFLVATVSLLPDFREPGDYRYFFFGSFHAVMLVDLFSGKTQSRWLPLLAGIGPIIFVVRGIIHDPEILSLSLDHRFSFPLDHGNTAGYVLAMSIPLALAARVAKPVWRPAVAWASCAGQVFGLILTFSRGAWVGWGAAILCFLATTKKWKWVAVLLAVAGTAILISPELQRRVTTFARPAADEAMRTRLQFMRGALKAGLENPILGVGYGRGRLKEAVRPHLQGTGLESSPIWHSHSLYTELFAVTGFLGLTAFLWLIGDVFYRLSRATVRNEEGERLLGYGLVSSWVAAVVTGIGDVPFYHHETRIFFFTLVAFAHIYDFSASKSSEPNCFRAKAAL